MHTSLLIKQHIPPVRIEAMHPLPLHKPTFFLLQAYFTQGQPKCF